ncbi:HNH/endonuclease VII fold putative polymorphic toxin [Bacteroides sp.]|uniref:HNH/endonuclease VII fold putative polymorphic toxin n=1 Tax=Bacteroides sp. TaxID=29523 RepID=UPI0026073D8C|nr:HNH/endonuclease VII fold putative polymorphic toxin [Bacteroides sp.]MDD3036927.1 HNH/endonuclease VII fold putative polymorphic toxin [Bacteroides sp.]
MDPNGEWIESAWDVFSLVTGAQSFVDNVKQGNVGAAIVDGLGVVANGVALALPLVPEGVGATIKGVRAVDKAVDAVRGVDKATDATKTIGKIDDAGQAAKKFDGGLDTKSVSGNEALRNAKDQNGIPRRQQPDKTIKPNTPEGATANLNNRNVRQYEYTNSKGEKVTIRQDKPATYGQGGKGDQSPHYNAEKNEKLKQHHYYGN